jgi:tryptophan synthase beta subunit
MTGGRPGVLHGNRTYLLQDATGRSSRRIRSRPASTIRASGRSIPGCTRWAASTYVSATDNEALEAFQLCTRLEGIIPRSKRAWPRARDEAGADAAARTTIVMNLSGRGDKDVAECRPLPRDEDLSNDHPHPRASPSCKADKRSGLVTFVMAGDPDLATSARPS